ncbi:P2X purinoceptor 3-like [Clupea harengus]|uniref:P2X purinoceptor n=1 Tax=Clupea harengus TaxID=7950 RepID=A0A6P8EDA9_CLUHA|nr:P2X purinoceptor 3-like [Clupea harengus]
MTSLEWLPAACCPRGRMLGFITDFFTYETTKSVVVKSWLVGSINRFVQLLIIIYFVGWVFLHERSYQTKSTGIESAVMTKVKGFGRYNNQVMDVADYVVPQQGTSVFCIITRLIVTINQTQGVCPQYGRRYVCTQNSDCDKHLGSNLANGIFTGNCLTGYCEIEGWCPTENDTVQTEYMEEVENFTIFIKNSVRFAHFDITRGNFPADIDIKCIYHPVDHPYCPVFRVRDILTHANESFSTIARQGGQIGIHIRWMCDFDQALDRCKPSYSFTRLDDVFENNTISKGYNFRFAKYYKTPDEEDYRTLHKAFGIHFDVMVSGHAGKFDVIPTLINIVAACTSVGLATVLCDIILLNFLRGADQYKAKKFEEVSEVDIHAESRSQSLLTLKNEGKISEDSETVANGQQL